MAGLQAVLSEAPPQSDKPHLVCTGSIYVSGTVGSTAALFTIFLLKEVLDFPTRESCYEQSQLVQSQAPRKRWGWDLSPSQCVDNSDVPNGRTCRFVFGQLVLLIIASHHWEPHILGLQYSITHWADWFWTLFRCDWKSHLWIPVAEF